MTEYSDFITMIIIFTENTLLQLTVSQALFLMLYFLLHYIFLLIYPIY